MTKNAPELGAIFLLVCFVGLLGNLITLLLIAKRKAFSNRQNGNIFLGNLAFVDLMACIISSVLALSYIDSKLRKSEFMCSASMLLTWIIRPTGLLSLTLLTLNRFYAVTKTNAWKVFTKRYSWFYVCGVWCLAILVFAGLSTGVVMFSDNKITGACSLLPALFQQLKPLLFAIQFITTVVITYCNIKIWQYVKGHNQRIANQNVIPEDVAKARNIRLAKLVAIIFLNLVIVYMIPAFIITFINRGVTANALQRTLAILYTVNHANNFFIFVAANKNFRDDVKKMFANCKLHHE